MNKIIFRVEGYFMTNKKKSLISCWIFLGLAIFFTTVYITTDGSENYNALFRYLMLISSGLSFIALFSVRSEMLNEKELNKRKKQ